jgi:PDZ domain-containing protein
VAISPHKPLDLRDRVLVEGKRVDPPNGRLFLVGVQEAEVSVLQQWLLSLDKAVTMTPKDTSDSQLQADKKDRAAIVTSKQVATAVALRMLGEKVPITGSGADIIFVAKDGPAASVLKPGDRIVTLNGKPVRTSVDVTDRIASLPPGTRITLGIRRAARPAIVTLRTASPVQGDITRRSRIGIALDTPDLKIKLPVKVDFSTGEIVGPSAGLAFALAVFDSRSAVDLLRGRYVVATGALALDGSVQPVGGIRQKAIATQRAGYDLLLVPVANAPDARKAVKEFCEGGKCVKIVPVSSAQEAVELLRLDSQELEQRITA